MISFFTEFPVEQRDPSLFVDAVAEWLDGSPHSKFSRYEIKEISSNSISSISNSREKIEVMNFHSSEFSSVGFRYFTSSDEVDWITTACFSNEGGVPWSSVRTEHFAKRLAIELPPAKKPFLLRNITHFMGNGIDGEIVVGNSPIVLNDGEEEIVSDILLGKSESHLPIIFVSHPFDERRKSDHAALAKQLACMAHVLIEPSRAFSRRLQELTASRNPYGGFLGLVLSGGQVRPIDPSDFASTDALDRYLIGMLRNALCERRALPKCSWPYIEALVARSVIEQLKENNSGDVDEYVQAFDAEIRAKDDQIRIAEGEINRLRKSLSDAHTSMSKSTEVVIKFGNEQELSTNEFEEILTDCLDAGRRNILEGSRRANVIDAAMACLKRTSNLDKRRESLKNILTGYRNMNKKTKESLESLGFAVVQKGDHPKLIYGGDARYVATIPASGSDVRGGLNSALEIGRRFF